MQTNSNQVSAIQGNQVDAAVIPATIALPLVARNQAHLLGWSGDETPWQLGAIFTTKHTIAERRPMLVSFIAAYRQAAREFYDAFLVKGPDGKRQEGAEAPALLTILSKSLGQPPDVIKNGIAYVDPDGRLLVRDIYKQIAWYQAHGMVDKSIDPASVLDLSFVEGHYQR